MNQNKHGLSRSIPASIKRQVRQNSKFGCVNCRSGVFTYEHFDPPFSDARAHDSSGMCLLCGTCQLLSSKGALSKATIAKKYAEIANADSDEVMPAFGPFDFQGDHAELHIGGFSYRNGLGTILRAYGEDTLRLNPYTKDTPPSIDGVFYDEAGREVFRIENSGWTTKPASWDFITAGKSLEVLSGPRRTCLRISALPPRGIVLERLDMRFGEHHIICRNGVYVIGRHVKDDIFDWFYSGFAIERNNTASAAFEIVTPDVMEQRWGQIDRRKPCYDDPPNELLLASNFGIACRSIGVIAASNCDQFQFRSYARGILPIGRVRQVLNRAPLTIEYELSRGGSPRWYNINKQRREFESIGADPNNTEFLIDWSIIANPDLPPDR